MPYVRPGRLMRFPRGMGDVLCADGATAADAGSCFDVNTGDVIGSVPLPAPVVYTPTPAASTPAAPASSLDALFANLAIGGENILGKVVAPAYQQTCTAAGCTTTVAGGSPTPGGLPGVPGSLGGSSSLLLIGGVALLAVLFMVGKK